MAHSEALIVQGTLLILVIFSALRLVLNDFRLLLDQFRQKKRRR
jgi:hypothetical protein